MKLRFDVLNLKFINMDEKLEDHKSNMNFRFSVIEDKIQVQNVLMEKGFKEMKQKVDKLPEDIKYIEKRLNGLVDSIASKEIQKLQEETNPV